MDAQWIFATQSFDHCCKEVLWLNFFIVINQLFEEWIRISFLYLVPVDVGDRHQFLAGWFFVKFTLLHVWNSSFGNRVSEIHEVGEIDILTLFALRNTWVELFNTSFDQLLIIHFRKINKEALISQVLIFWCLSKFVSNLLSSRFSFHSNRCAWWSIYTLVASQLTSHESFISIMDGSLWCMSKHDSVQVSLVGC